MKALHLPLLVIIFTSCAEQDYNFKNKNYFLEGQLEKIESLIVKKELINEEVSSVSVAWHLDHILKTINSIYSELETSNPKEFEGRFNFMRTVVFTTGTIPRGIAKSPTSVLPPDIILEKDILKQLSEARSKLKRITDLNEDAFFNHPRFEHLNRNETLRFIEIHTNHHLKIIADILNK